MFAKQQQHASLSEYPTGAAVENGDWFLWGHGSRATMARVCKWEEGDDGPWYVVWDEGYGYLTLEEALFYAKGDYDVFSPDLRSLAHEAYDGRREDA